MKKRKLFVRIVAAMLVAVTLLSIVISVVSATEVDTNETTATTLPTDERVEVEPANVPSIQLCNLPEDFDQPVVTIFVGNIETYKVSYVNLYQKDNYMAAVNLEDGYYIVYANGYSWNDKNDVAYAVNGGIYAYMYLGDVYDSNLYGVNFTTTENGVFQLGISAAPNDFKQIKYGSDLIVTKADLEYPDDAKLDRNHNHTDISNDENQNGAKQENKVTFFDMILGMIKDSALLLILLVGCLFAYNIIKIKKQMAAEKQAEDDRCDDQHID